MPEPERQNVYRTALDEAQMELDTIQEQFNQLKIRMGHLERASEALELLLTSLEQGGQPGQKPPSGLSEPDQRFTEFQQAKTAPPTEFHRVQRFQRAIEATADPLQQRIQSALVSPSFA